MDVTSQRPARQLLALFGGRRTLVVALVGSSVLGGLCEAAVLAVIAQAAGALVAGSRTVRADVGSVTLATTVNTLLVLGLVLALARLALQFPVSILPARISAEVQARLQDNLFGAYTTASWTAKSQDREGALQELMTNQALQASYAAMAATGLVTAGLTLVVLLGSAFLLNPVAAVAVSGTAVALLGLLRPLNRLAANRSRALSQAQMNMASAVGQSTRLAEETEVFGVGAAERRTIARAVASIRHLFFQTQMLGRIGPSIYQSAIYLLVVVGLGLISALHAGHVASLGAVVLLLIRAGSYGQAVQGNYVAVRQMLPFLERVQAVERGYLVSAPARGTHRLPLVRSLAFDAVTFAYAAERPVLEGVTFSVAAGETIGVIGPSGAGKSTLVQLLLGLRRPDQGSYLVNDVAASAIARTDWNRAVAYVPQDPKLLHASVADNIRYWRDIPPDAVEAAARVARIHDEIVSWADGYDTLIGPRADAISGGQRQRICIARALAGTPQILILDEPTSALDPRSESLLQESLRALKIGLTLIIVAHRLSTLDIADRIMVIVDGRLDAFDTAAALSRTNAYYRLATRLGSKTTLP